MAPDVTIPTLDAEPFARTEQLFSLFESKRMLLEDLRTIGVAQSDAISQQDISELLNLLGRKQGIMDRLIAIQKQMLDFQEDDPEARVWSSPERRRMCQETKRVCDQWIQEILVMEERAGQLMTAQRDAIAGQLLQAADSMRLARAYGFDGPSDLDSDGSLLLDG
jgi:flagellar biosynthesis/type III secretory pathway chaperone